MTAVARSRMDATLKKDAERILSEVGLTPSDAIRLLYKQVVNRGTFPLELKAPNAKTAAALQEAAVNANAFSTFDTFDDLLDETNQSK